MEPTKAPGNHCRAPVVVRGEVIGAHKFKFSCGFEVPLKQIQWMVPYTSLKAGDKVSLRVDILDIDKHTHKYVCECGEAHNHDG